MSIDLDDGVHRSIMFKAPGSYLYYFRLNTWPGHLCISGDTGTYVFSRSRDMFEFFRNPQQEINVSYWSEKLVSRSRQEVEEYDEDKFKEAVFQEFKSYWDCRLGSPEDYAARGRCWSRLREEILEAAFYDEVEAKQEAGAFREEGFSMSDIWEADITSPSTDLIRCMYAITWGIHQYDLAMELEQTSTHADGIDNEMSAPSP